MSATPIPRTLALVLYENMNYIKIPDKPSSQKKTKSAVYSDHKRQKVYSLVQDHLDKGIQTYWVCTRVEDTTDDTLQSVKMFSEIIKNKFPKYRTAVLHGKILLAFFCALFWGFLGKSSKLVEQCRDPKGFQ